MGLGRAGQDPPVASVTRQRAQTVVIHIGYHHGRELTSPKCGGGDNFIETGGGRTPLQYACAYGNPAVVALLVKRKRSVDLYDSDGNTPLMKIFVTTTTKTQNIPDHIRIATLLRSYSKPKLKCLHFDWKYTKELAGNGESQAHHRHTESEFAF
ncbi:uncharacterized protein LOC110597289 isoform X3 [Ictidomys tridecemlineatus]